MTETLIPCAERRAEISEIGRKLAGILEIGEDAIAVNFAAHIGASGVPDGFASVTISTAQAAVTSEAVSLVDAIYMARGKLARLAAQRAEEAAKKKAATKSVDQSPKGGDGVAGSIADESAVANGETPETHPLT
jgi:hypothetical protein